MGADAVDIGKTIHPHPTLGESMGLAATGDPPRAGCLPVLNSILPQLGLCAIRHALVAHLALSNIVCADELVA